ncbi:hypothetical protein BDZ89DRAFT_1113312 [Hymenopellis radicata]|nr:hypothetical protein BDZ89DRAFT_1113312 [Hymenopellis radicata]
MTELSNKDLALLLYSSLDALQTAVDTDQSGAFTLLAKGHFMSTTTTQMGNLELIISNMTVKGKLKKFLADLPLFIGEGRRSILPHNTVIANALADVEVAYTRLKDKYKQLSGNEFDPNLPAQLPQASQTHNVSANHQNPGYPRSSMQSQESDIVFRRASDDSDTYQAPRYSMPGNPPSRGTYRATPSNTYQSPAHLHAPAGPGRGYSSPHLPLPASAGSQYPSPYSQHPSQRPAQYAAGYTQSVPHLPPGPAGSPYGQQQGYQGVPGLYAQQQPSTASVGTVYPGQPQQHMYGYGSGAYTPTNAAASAATLHNAQQQQQQQNQQYYQNPYYPSGQQ